MVSRFALFAALPLGFAYFVVPREPSAGDSTAPVTPGPSTAQQQAQTQWYSGDHVLERRSNGHFYALASVNGASANMLIDTGASVVALTREDAQAAGVHFDENDIRPIGRGANGPVYGVPTRLREVTLGGLSVRNVEAVVVPDGLDVSLLGQSFLSQLGSVEINGDTMTLSGR